MGPGPGFIRRLTPAATGSGFPSPGSRRRQAADLRRLTKIPTGSRRGNAVDSEPRAWIHPPAYAGGYGFRISLPR